MGKAQRVKGASFERQLAIHLRQLDPTARRNVEECQQASVDIKTELPLGIQAKNLARWSLTPHTVWEQAAMGSKPGQMPVAIVKIDRKTPVLCFVSLEDFLTLIEKAYGKEEDPNSSR